ncbi:efflux transporter outer membrane subunit [Lentisalinibacter salinarum]|uniref:efflux transporter outer membrane subunit n=1 Tax=Lentisalinibacter salinarum TaxID=2992239 RepID=UPI00386C7402
MIGMIKCLPRRVALAVLTTAGAVGLAGCAVGPDYEPPESDGGEWLAPPDGVTTESLPAEWWSLLEQPEIGGHVEAALAENRDLRAAVARVEEARALRGVAAAALWPRLDAEGSYTWYEQSLNSPGAASQIISAGLASRDGEFYNARLDASWELDLFGASRRRLEAADAGSAAAAAAAAGTALSVVAETVSAWIEYRGARKRLAVTRRSVDAQAETLELTRSKVEIGLARELDALRAEAELRSTRARLPALQAAAAASADRLAVLTGRTPGEVRAALAGELALPDSPASLPVGLRAEILRRRPDVIAAERELAAATAEVGGATAAFFPRLVLGASGGFEAGDVSDLATGDSRTLGIVPFLRWPVFQGGRLRAELRAAEARERAALARYEGAVLRALADAESALAAWAGERGTLAELRQASAAAAEAADIAARLYEQGLGDFLTVLDAERRLAETDDERVRAEIRALLALVRVYKALGVGTGVGIVAGEQGGTP